MDVSPRSERVERADPAATRDTTEAAGMVDSIPLDELERMRDESRRALERARRELERLESLIHARGRGDMALRPLSGLDSSLYPPSPE